jgi:hypothetical protein
MISSNGGTFNITSSPSVGVPLRVGAIISIPRRWIFFSLWAFPGCAGLFGPYDCSICEGWAYNACVHPESDDWGRTPCGSYSFPKHHKVLFRLFDFVRNVTKRLSSISPRYLNSSTTSTSILFMRSGVCVCKHIFFGEDVEIQMFYLVKLLLFRSRI